MPSTASQTTVDAYLARLPRAERRVLTAVREAIRRSAPDATEKIAYQVPVYFHNGWLISFKSGKNFLSLITMSHEVMRQLKRELSDYEVSGTSIHFSAGHSLPAALVMKIVKLRLAENAEKRRHPAKRIPRKRYPMPAMVKAALTGSLLSLYRARPSYQQNDYLMWIGEAKQHATKEKRLKQMLTELRQGNVYMKRTWKGKKSQ